MTTVEKIHFDIDTAQDRLLDVALKTISESSPQEEYADRHRKAGFVKSSIVAKGQSLSMSKEEAKLIEHYKHFYPFQKFLTIQELDRVCKKYNLIYAPVSSYIKNVPDKNLRDIETAPKLNDGDAEDEVILFKYHGKCQGITAEEAKALKNGVIISAKKFRFSSNSHNISEYLNRMVKAELETLNYTASYINQNGLFIAAPKSHFDLTGLNISGKGFFNMVRIEPKDPIVFRYVKGGVQVITKWGDEASDKDLINETMN